jgi:dihydrofolate reductase
VKPVHFRQTNPYKETVPMRISLIMAVSMLKNVIGKDGKVPWRLRSDMLRFKQLTEGHLVVMGRKTWESLKPPYRPLPQRGNIVLTRDRTFDAHGALVVHDLAALMGILRYVSDEIFVIGGAEVYDLFLQYASTLYITEVQAPVEGDTHYPYLQRFPNEEWAGVRQERTETDAQNEYVSTFMELHRRGNPSSS